MDRGFTAEPHQTERAYAAWAPIYDILCGPILSHGIRAAVEASRKSGRTILEVGVGTGLSFPYYDRDVELYGIDVSASMLKRAEKKRSRFAAVKSLRLMDAHDLDYDDDSFDAVVAPFVITLVNDPARVLSEAVRVVRGGGRICLVNRFWSERGMVALLERAFGPALRKIGGNPDFPFERITKSLAHDSRVLRVERAPAAPFFTLVTIEKAERGR